MSPSTNGSKLFTCVYLFVGLVIVSTCIKWVIEYAVQQNYVKEKSAAKSMLERLQNAVRSRTNLLLHTVDNNESPKWMFVVRVALISIGHIVLTIAFGTLFFTLIVDNMSLVNAIYFCCMTITTVGYGDVLPGNEYSKAFTMVYALCGTCITARALSYFHMSISEYERSNRYDLLFRRELDLMTLRKMDRCVHVSHCVGVFVCSGDMTVFMSIYLAVAFIAFHWNAFLFSVVVSLPL